MASDGVQKSLGLRSTSRHAMVLSQKDNQEAKDKVPIQAEMATKEELMAMEYHPAYGLTEVNKCYGELLSKPWPRVPKTARPPVQRGDPLRRRL